MSIVRSYFEIEEWLQANTSSWHPLSDVEYRNTVRSWIDALNEAIDKEEPMATGDEAISEFLASVAGRQVVIFNGLKVPKVANTGGHRVHAYRVLDLRDINRDLANNNELLMCDDTFEITCLFTHEAGSFSIEHVFESLP